MRREIRVIATVLCFAVIQTSFNLAADRSVPPRPPSAPAVGTIHGAFSFSKLSPVLAQLYQAHIGLAPPGSFRHLSGLSANGNSVSVVVEAVSGRTEEAAIHIDLVGGSVTGTHFHLVFATVPIARLPQLASINDIIRIRRPYHREPAVVGEGVAFHNATVLHNQGIIGSGVKVGVLDCGGFVGYEALLGSELPPAVTLWTGGSDPVGSNVHGTACAEIVHEMAPGAELFLAHDAQEAEFYSAVDWFIAEEVDVVSYSCSWIDGFVFDGGGLPHNPVNAKVSEARAAGILWVNSAGNYAYGDNYQQYFTDVNGDNWHDFDDYFANAYGYLQTGTSYWVVLTWDDWPANPATTGATQDYDLYLWYWDGVDWQQVASSNNPQNGNPGDLPFEAIEYTPDVDDWFWLAVWRVNASGSEFLNLRNASIGTFGVHNPEYSVGVPGNSPDALAAGAVFWNDASLEPYSGRGPTLGPGGTAHGGQLKPDLVAADGVSGATYGPSDGVAWPDGSGFFGTSSSCPHVAGGAALLLQAFPGMTPDHVEAQLFAAAFDMGDPGTDTDFGHGLMDLQNLTWVFEDGFESGDTSAWSSTMP